MYVYRGQTLQRPDDRTRFMVSAQHAPPVGSSDTGLTNRKIHALELSPIPIEVGLVENWKRFYMLLHNKDADELVNQLKCIFPPLAHANIPPATNLTLFPTFLSTSLFHGISHSAVPAEASFVGTSIKGIHGSLRVCIHSHKSYYCK